MRPYQCFAGASGMLRIPSVKEHSSRPVQSPSKDGQLLCTGLGCTWLCVLGCAVLDCTVLGCTVPDCVAGALEEHSFRHADVVLLRSAVTCFHCRPFFALFLSAVIFCFFSFLSFSECCYLKFVTVWLVSL